MQNKTLKSLTQAHAWVGIIISSVLFVIFITGSLSLFRDNMSSWERASLTLQSDQNISSPAYDLAVNNLQKHYDIDVHHGFFLREPSQHSPFIEVYFATELPSPHPVTGEDHQDRHLLISPTTGEVIADAEQFEFATFIYQLHYNLGLGKAGAYFVGLVTLFFFVALLSGLVIHWRKLASNFFQYRQDKNKDKWRDAHNLIGTMGLPFHIMYAFTGLVFNLVIIFQISYALVLYGGDQTALLQAAGFNEPQISEAQQPRKMVGIDTLRARALETMGDVSITSIVIDNIGDDNAVLTFKAKSNDAFSNLSEVQYMLKDQRQIYLTTNSYNNAVRSGLATIASLHFGDFAGYGMRIAFFILGLASAYIIVTGNLMWLAKREKQKQYSTKKLTFVRRLTCGTFTGVMLSLAVGFTVNTLLPITVESKMLIIQMAMYTGFIATLLGALLSAHTLSYTIATLYVSIVGYLLSAVMSGVYLATHFTSLATQTRVDIVIVITLLGVMSALCLVAIRRIYAHKLSLLSTHSSMPSERA
ncbi:PepSY-associated TM helix domain-containing protein (plasmid) [Pseudoalteromonas sp. T1lg65]|uniref:PepSY-associated TM helix domain-containing protein n=1 Tax=Pseudoalteromonas sp. T1lg65 TaxID=2077101 RepID=UPI003F7B1DAD